jgi:Ca-activated chloride channel family protein
MSGYTLSELARQAGVSSRTVRYYIQRGLLHAPEFRGPDTQYDDAHVLRLRAIRVLQDAYWPLDAISSTLHGKSAEQLRAITNGKLPQRVAVAVAAGTVGESATAPTPESTRSPRRSTRFSLADGLELWLDDEASASVKRLADAVRAFASDRLQTRKGGER